MVVRIGRFRNDHVAERFRQVTGRHMTDPICGSKLQRIDIPDITLHSRADTPEPLLQMGHDSRASPTVKKRWRSTVCGTFAGYRAELRLRRLLLKLVAKEVSLWEGRLGIITKSVLELELTYCKMVLEVLLSTATGASMNERAAMKYVPLLLLA